MGKKEFQEFQAIVKKDGGYILSDGTLNLEHLLSKAYDFLVQYGLNEKLQKEILEVFTFDVEFKPNCHSLFMSQYYDEARINDEKMDDANYLWNEDIYNYFWLLAPHGYYYGSNEGDMACIGWFKNEEDNEGEDDE